MAGKDEEKKWGEVCILESWLSPAQAPNPKTVLQTPWTKTPLVWMLRSVPLGNDCPVGQPAKGQIFQRF